MPGAGARQVGPRGGSRKLHYGRRTNLATNAWRSRAFFMLFQHSQCQYYQDHHGPISRSCHYSSLIHWLLSDISAATYLPLHRNVSAAT